MGSLNIEGMETKPSGHSWVFLDTYEAKSE